MKPPHSNHPQENPNWYHSEDVKRSKERWQSAISDSVTKFHTRELRNAIELELTPFKLLIEEMAQQIKDLQEQIAELWEEMK